MGEANRIKGRKRSVSPRQKYVSHLFKGVVVDTDEVASSIVASFSRKADVRKKPEPSKGPEPAGRIAPLPPPISIEPPKPKQKEPPSAPPPPSSLLLQGVYRSGDPYFQPPFSSKPPNRKHADMAMNLVAAAERLIIKQDETVFAELTPERERILRSLADHPLFAHAIAIRDPKTALALALDEIEIDLQLANLGTTHPGADADDVSEIITTWRNNRDPITVSRMRELTATHKLVDAAVAVSQENRQTWVYEPEVAEDLEDLGVKAPKPPPEKAAEQDAAAEPRGERDSAPELSMGEPIEAGALAAEIDVSLDELYAVAEGTLGAAPEPEPPRPITLVFPIPNYTGDNALEAALPEKIDERSKSIRRVARLLAFYVHGRTAHKDVPEVYQQAVIELRSEYSPQAVVRLATELVDMSLGRRPSKIPPRSDPAPDAAYDEKLSCLGMEQLGYYMAHFGDERPDENTLENVVRLFRKIERMADLIDPSQDYNTMNFLYDPATTLLLENSEHHHPEAREFEISLNIATGCIRILKGLENPSLAPLDGMQVIAAAPLPDIEAASEAGDAEEKIILAVLGKGGQCTDEVIGEFRKMHPGLRELRMEQFLSSIWIRGDYAEMENYRAAKAALSRSCKRPSSKQKLEAVRNPKNLSPVQLDIVSSLFGVPRESIEAKHIEGLRVWMRGDRRELQSYWKKHYHDKKKLLELLGKMNESRPRLNKQQATLLASVLKVKKLTADDRKRTREVDACIGTTLKQEKFWFSSSREERDNFWKRTTTDLLSVGELAHKIRFDQHGYPDSYTAPEQELVAWMCEKPVPEVTPKDLEELKAAFINKTEDSCYVPEIMSLGKHYGVFSAEGLRHTAQRASEYRTLMGFFGIPVKETSAVVDYSIGISVKAGKTNEDAFSCVRLGDGTTLKAVFDGIGGQQEGEMASSIAKEIFEISAISGWIQSAEDIRRVIVMADIAITMAQISKKQFAADDKMENTMGTTAVITMKKGDRFHGVHCGDSLYKIIRDGMVILQAEPHDTAYLHRQIGVELNPQANTANVVTSSLGASSLYITINNSSGAEEFILKGGDVELVASDGVTDVMANEEYPLIIEECGGDIAKARDRVMETAGERSEKGKAYHTVTGSVVKGKQDDKTLLMERHRSEGK